MSNERVGENVVKNALLSVASSDVSAPAGRLSEVCQRSSIIFLKTVWKST